MMRLQKILSQAGVASRREAEELILQGRVTVDGRLVNELGIKADVDTQDVRVDGVRVRFKPMVYLLFYKPRGYICSRKDPQGRPTIYHFFKDYPVKLFSVGRLDYDAEGLLLLTNDGDLTYNLTHPKKGIEKIYLVKVKGVPDYGDIRRLKEGIFLYGRKTAPAKAVIIEKSEKNSWLKLTIYEGRYRQIKGMCLSIGHPAIKIKRIGFSFLRLGDLRQGCFRALSREEVLNLKGIFQ